jgi:hypothetical protein
MFQFPSLPRAPYVFRYASQRITTGGFPHSEISGSKVGQHLTRAYRSRPRPSSALGAKASTVCPYSLDREELIIRSYGVFKVRASSCPPNENAGLMSPQGTSTGLSKLNSERLQPGEQALSVEVDVDLGEPGHGRLKCV